MDPGPYFIDQVKQNSHYDMLELYKQVVDLKKVELVTQHMEVMSAYQTLVSNALNNHCLLARPLFATP